MFAIESELTNNVVDEQNNKTENNCKCYTTMNCEYYKSVTGMAVYLVDEILYEASNNLKLLKNDSDYCICRDGGYYEISHWPAIKDFNIELGKKKITEFLNGFSFSEKWLFFVRYSGSYSDKVSDFCMYEAIYSIPTNMYPIPQATASLYFYFEVSRILPSNCPVVVKYRLEASRTVFSPYEMDFTEELLFLLINSKLNTYQMFKF